MPPTRNTFVVSVHDRGGAATVEEVRTGRKARVASLSAAATQIERWLRRQAPARVPSEDGR
jgi:hypothetical protein